MTSQQYTTGAASIMETEETLNVAQAAALLFVDTETVLLLARQGELPGTKIGKPWVFLRQDILDYLRLRIQRDTDARRRQFQAAQEPQAVLMPMPGNSRRRPPPALPDLPAAMEQPTFTKAAPPGRSRAYSHSASTSADRDDR